MSRSNPAASAVILGERLAQPFKAVGTFFNEKSEINHADVNTHAIYHYEPSNREGLAKYWQNFKNSIYKLAGYTSEASTTAFYNADQIAFTPARVAAWVVSIGGAAGLAIISPWFVLLAVVPLAAFVIGGIVRAAYRKSKGERSVVLFEKRIPAAERERITIRQRSIKRNGELLNEADVAIKLYSWAFREEVTPREKIESLKPEEKINAREDGKEIYFSAYYKRENDESKASQFITHIKLSPVDRDAYLGLSDAAKPAKALEIKNAYLNRKEVAIVIEGAEPTSILRKHYANMSRFEIIRETLWVPLKFFFGVAMPYWAIWSIASLLGQGFMEVQGNTEFLLPFSSFGLAFGLPLAIGVALGIARAVLAYRNRNIPKNDPEIEARAKILLSLSTSEERAKAEWAKAGLDTDLQTRANALHGLRTEQTHVLRASWSSFFYGFKTLFVKDYSIRNMLSTSLLSSIIRIITHTAVRFASGFIIAFISAWPILDFAILNGFSGGTAGFIQFGLSLVLGVSFGVYAAWNQAKIEIANHKQLNAIKKDPALLNHLLALEDELRRQRTEVATLEKEVNALLSEKSREQGTNSLKKAKLNFVQRLFSRSYSIAQARESLDEQRLIDGEQSIIKHDSWTYRGKNQPQSSTKKERTLTFFERAFDRINEFLAAGGSAALMVRLAVGASTMALGIGGSLTLFGGALLVPGASAIPLGIILAFAIFGTAWALVRLFKLLDGKNERFKKLFLSQTPALSESLMVNECLTLEARQARLLALQEQLTNPIAIADPAAVPALDANRNPLSAAPSPLAQEHPVAEAAAEVVATGELAAVAAVPAHSSIASLLSHTDADDVGGAAAVPARPSVPQASDSTAAKAPEGSAKKTTDHPPAALFPAAASHSYRTPSRKEIKAARRRRTAGIFPATATTAAVVTSPAATKGTDPRHTAAQRSTAITPEAARDASSSPERNLAEETVRLPEGVVLPPDEASAAAAASVR